MHRIKRETDLPIPFGLSNLVWLIKSIEALFLKLLEVFKIYKSKKYLLIIPSLATRRFTVLQAALYHGSSYDVLHFKPTRLFHKILKGLPDLVSWEKIQLEVQLSSRQIQKVEQSTESRGFIHLQLPWLLPWSLPKLAYPAVKFKGAETVFGLVKLGSYEVHHYPTYFLHDKIKWIVVSDVDDTIKDSKISETTGFKKIVTGLFQGNYYTYDAVEGMSSLYRKLSDKGVFFIYLTSTPFQLAPFLIKFLYDNEFPMGPVFVRWLGYGRFAHKWRVLHRLLSNIDHQKLLLIGDSGEQDLSIYRRVQENETYGKKIAHTYIRHVPGTPRQRLKGSQESSFANAKELEVLILNLIGT